MKCPNCKSTMQRAAAASYGQRNIYGELAEGMIWKCYDCGYQETTRD